MGGCNKMAITWRFLSRFLISKLLWKEDIIRLFIASILGQILYDKNGKIEEFMQIDLKLLEV